MSNPLFIKNVLAGAAISPFRILKFSAADTVIMGAAATDSLIGVSNEVGAASGERQDMVLEGIAFVEASAAFAQGAPITSDATGRAVTAAPGAGVNNRLIGFAYEAAAATGDVVRVFLTPSVMQG